MASPALDVLTQGYQVMTVRGITSTTSLWLSPIRPTSTSADSAHTPGLRGFVRNPSAFVAPWILKDIASNVDDIGVSYHESTNLKATASHLGVPCALLVISRGLDPTRDGVLHATLVTRERFEATNLVRVGTSDHQEFHNSSATERSRTSPSTTAPASLRGARGSSRSSASATSLSSRRSMTRSSPRSRCS